MCHPTCAYTSTRGSAPPAGDTVVRWPARPLVPAAVPLRWLPAGHSAGAAPRVPSCVGLWSCSSLPWQPFYLALCTSGAEPCAPQTPKALGWLCVWSEPDTLYSVSRAQLKRQHDSYFGIGYAVRVNRPPHVQLQLRSVELPEKAQLRERLWIELDSQVHQGEGLLVHHYEGGQ